MIETSEYEKIPGTILHRVTGETEREKVKRSIDETDEIINEVIKKYGRFNLIIEIRGHGFSDLAAHKMWKMLLTQNSLIKKKVNYTAFIVDDSPHTRAEKELMETENVKFFFDFNDGSNWLQKVIEKECGSKAKVL